ncbi:hypothetical protein INR49_006575 [Caranx melampygus]|nr:hypothetical protein INR49_006575 [Caranx melampygus]
MEESAAGGNASSPAAWEGRAGQSRRRVQSGGSRRSGRRIRGRADGAGPGRGSTQSGRTNWSQSPTSTMHIPGAPLSQFSSMEEMNVGSNRAKRYSSQRQRAVPEPAPPIHLGDGGTLLRTHVVPGTIYAHGDAPAPIQPQGMLVQPEMHIPHLVSTPTSQEAQSLTRPLRRPTGVSVTRATPATAAPAFLPSARSHDLPLPAMYPTLRSGWMVGEELRSPTETSANREEGGTEVRTDSTGDPQQHSRNDSFSFLVCFRPCSSRADQLMTRVTGRRVCNSQVRSRLEVGPVGSDPSDTELLTRRVTELWKWP